MSKVTVTFDAADISPQEKYRLLADLTTVLGQYGNRVPYEVREGSPSNFNVFIHTLAPEVQKVAKAVREELDRQQRNRGENSA